MPKSFIEILKDHKAKIISFIIFLGVLGYIIYINFYKKKILPGTTNRPTTTTTPGTTNRPTTTTTPGTTNRPTTTTTPGITTTPTNSNPLFPVLDPVITSNKWSNSLRTLQNIGQDKLTLVTCSSYNANSRICDSYNSPIILPITVISNKEFNVDIGQGNNVYWNFIYDDFFQTLTNYTVNTVAKQKVINSYYNKI